MNALELTRRRTAVAWLAFGFWAGSFFFLAGPRGAVFAAQYSFALAILTLIGFRWWTNPVHPGAIGYLSPHTIILLHSFFYFGLGSLPRLAFPDAEIVGYHNINADEYYFPALLLGLAGLLVFDLVYRRMSRRLELNTALESSLDIFQSPQLQGFIPVAALFWYTLCLGVFVYMSRLYIMRSYAFIGVQGSLDNIMLQSGYWLIGTAWIMISLFLFKAESRSLRVVILVLMALLLPIMFGYQNRRIIVYSLAVTVLVYFANPRRLLSLKAVIWALSLVLGAFILMTSVRLVATSDPSLKRFIREEKNIFRRTLKIITAPEFLDLAPVNAVIRTTAFSRLNGLDWAAAIMEGRINYGKPFLWGSHNLPAAATVIPRVIWPNKPTPNIEGMINRHFELAYFDQLGSLLGSAYADGGALGVLIGFGLLGLLFPPAVGFIWRRKTGMIAYLGAMLPLLAYENFILKYIFEWLRWVLILLVVNSVLYWLFFLAQVRREGAETG